MTAEGTTWSISETAGGEDCGYCSQRLNSARASWKYSWLTPEQAVEQAQHGIMAARAACAW